MSGDCPDSNVGGRAVARPPRSGFSLIELMLVVSIVAVLVSLAAIRYSTYNYTSKGLRCCAELRQIASARVAAAAERKGQSGDYELTGAKLHEYANTTLANSGTTFKCPYDNTTVYTIPRDMERPPTCGNYRTEYPALHTIEDHTHDTAAQ